MVWATTPVVLHKEREVWIHRNCYDSTLPLPGTQVCRLHPPFTWDSGVQIPPSLYLGLRCADSTLPLPGTQVCRFHPPFTWDSGVQTPPSLYLGLRCADSTLPLPGTQVCRQSGQSAALITQEKRKPNLDVD